MASARKQWAVSDKSRADYHRSKHKRFPNHAGAIFVYRFSKANRVASCASSHSNSLKKMKLFLLHVIPQNFSYTQVHTELFRYYSTIYFVMIIHFAVFLICYWYKVTVWIIVIVDGACWRDFLF